MNGFYRIMTNLEVDDLEILVDLYDPNSSPGGLCNRLRAIGGAMTLSKILNLPIRVHWSEDHKSFPGQIEDIFELDNLPEAMEIQRTPLIIETSIAPLREQNETRRTTLIRGGIHPRRIFQSQEAAVKGMIGEFFGLEGKEEMERKFIQTSWEQLRNLLNCCVSEEVFRRKEEMQKKLGESYLGLHVRLTDLITSKISRGKDVGDFPNNYIDKLLNSTAEEKREVYIATDSIEGLDGITSACDLSFHHLPRESFATSGHRLTSNSDAMVDLLILAESSTLIGTRGSSFSETASKLGRQTTALVS